MQFNRSISLALLSSLFVVGPSCGERSRSRVSEDIDPANDPALLGAASRVRWDDVKSLTTAERPMPWSDTYWPLFEKGMAARWNFPEGATKSDEGLIEEPRTLSLQIDQMLRAWKNNDKSLMAVLSPAEKYELLKTGGKELPPALKKALENHQRNYDARFSAFDAKLREIDARLLALYDERALAYEEYWRLYDQVSRFLTELQSLKLLRETRDPRTSREALEGRMEAARSRIDERRVPLAEVAARLQRLDGEVEALWQEQANLRTDADTDKKSFAHEIQAVAQQVTSVYPLLGSGWKEWAYYTSTLDSESWGWMGHCHGWAPASLTEEPPRHAVLAIKDGREILLTEGDLRGLLTKVWADQAPRARFAGQRCNSDDVRLDPLGRVMDGQICMGASGSCAQELGRQIYVRSFRQNEGILQFVESPLALENKVAIVLRRGENDDYAVRVYPNTSVFRASIAKIRRGDYSGSQAAVVHVTMGCRDTNPATLHLTLHELIGKQKTGFVMDKTRTSEVWNQPVYKYEMEYVPVLLTDGTSVPGGIPAPVERIDDAFSDYRAKGTRYLVQVRSTLHYGVENGPLAHFESEDDASSTDVMSYTLELDAQQRIIGGEWGLVQGTRVASEDALYEAMSQPTPDFLWTIPQGQKPTSGPIDYALIKKLHLCSLQPVGLKSMTVHPSLELPVQYTECRLD